jgi:uncharacterized protein
VADVLIISGAGPYADQWHPFAETSARLAAVIGDLGHHVRVADDVEGELLAGPTPDLLVLNVGSSDSSRPAETCAAIGQVLLDHLAAGRGLLGVHASATSFTGVLQWPEIIGGVWVWGESMHPELGPARIELVGDHPVVAGLPDHLEVVDERYTGLVLRPGITVLGQHEHEGRRHPMIWARESGPGRVVYDGLGHDTRSYDSPDHVRLLQRSVPWLLGEDA